MMMPAPACPDHGRLVLDLALGRLDDQSAFAAEAARLSCPECAAWWRSQLEGAAAPSVDKAVGTAFASFQPPASSRVARWLPVAAAATLAAGAGLLWYQHGAVQTSVATAPPSPLARESFEGDRDGNGVVGLEDLGFAVHVEKTRDVIFSDTLEDGELAGWTPHT
jgi:hypothetical protein